MHARDITVLVGVLLIITMLIIPLPNIIISILIIVNITLALIIILVAMNTTEPLQFSIFPSLLLLVTLFRLGLNVSTTRAILGKADAGNVIQTFGEFVIGGNALVGFVIFLILVIIQFIVITKGAERVSEVSARFTLDAMPGKQMSIDADLNAGMISDQQAKQRREKIEKEADFHGAMDGASKFVKGDAIAGIIIVIINIIFGIIIGMMQMGMEISGAVHTYTLLTVGDGLVSQIPALIISTATGIVVTRAASQGNLGEDVTKQLLAYPKLLYAAAATIAMLGFLTPIYQILTLPMAILLAAGGYILSRSYGKEGEDMDSENEEPEEELKSPESMMNLLSFDPIEFEFGYGLIPLADADQGGDMLDRIVMIRRQLALELGLVIPVVRLRDNMQLQPNAYRINMRGTEVARYEVLLDHDLVMITGTEDENLEGIKTTEPAFGFPALWIDEGTKEQAEQLGYTVVDPPSVISTHLTEIIKKHAHELLGREETKQLIDHLKASYPTLVEEVTPDPLSIGDVQSVLAKLLRENISIRNLPLIFETLANYGPMSKDGDLLTEYARQNLSRQISEQYTSDNGQLKVVTVSGGTEKKFADAIQQTEHGNYLAMDPDDTQAFYESAATELQQLQMAEQTPVILCSPAIRMYIQHLLERFLPEVAVLSYNELEPNVEVQSLGVVNIS